MCPWGQPPIMHLGLLSKNLPPRLSSWRERFNGEVEVEVAEPGILRNGVCGCHDCSMSSLGNVSRPWPYSLMRSPWVCVSALCV